MLSECSPGFWGWNCTNRCPENHYGKRCKTQCSCNETQICHHVCGCLQRLDLDNSHIKKNGASIFLKNVTSSPYAEECPSTKDVLSTNTGLSTAIVLFSSKHHISAKQLLFSH